MYQKIIIVGNLGGDPQMRYLPDGTGVTSFSIASNRRWNDRGTGQPVEETTWFRVTVWGRQAETAQQYLTKGQLVLVEGRITPDRNTGGPRLWTAQDGTVRASFEVHADNYRMMGSRAESGYDDRGDFDSSPAEEEDEIPF